MTKGDNISLYQNLLKLGKLSGVKFTYVVAKNIAILKPEFEALMKAVEEGEKDKEFNTKRISLAESYAKKDENGKAIKTFVGNVEKFVLEDEVGFEKSFVALKEEYKEVLNARKAQIEEQNEFLKTESTITLYKVKLENIPENITSEEMQSIIDIVEE